jgi:glycosyltransferase involved in cell wall biosynthesis
MANLAEELRRQGVHPTILTAQWDSHWPREIDFAGTPVVRLPQSSLRGWGTIRYMWSLSRWLREHRDEIDAVVVSSLRYDAYAAISALQGTPIPVVLRAEGSGTTGDCQWQRATQFGARIKQRCLEAAAIIAPCEAIAAELTASHYPAYFVQRIADGVPIPAIRTRELRQAARMTLGEANPDMKVTMQTPVGLYTGRLLASRGLHDLVRAWRKVIDVWPDARLWLVGEGPEREDLYDRLRDHELKYHVAMPGAFDDVADLLAAADVFLLPSHEEGVSLSLLEAMAAGVPVIASDLTSHQRLLLHGEAGLLVPRRNPTALAEAIAQVITVRDEAQRRAERARSLVEEQYSVTRMAEQYVRLIENLTAAKKTD